jgi:RNA polymerase sigma-70 factor, ECF subfamily
MSDPADTAESMPAEGGDGTAELLQRWHAGDRQALHELVQRDMPWIRARVRQRLGDALRQHGDTEDFLHEAVIDILNYTPRFLAADRDLFRRLVTRIVENSLRGQSEFYSRLRRDRGRVEPLPHDSVLDLDVQRRTGTTPSQHAVRNEEEAWLRLAMDLIEPEDRDVIVMREWSGEAFAEIGARLGIPENTARMRFSRALGRLAAQVEALRRGIV